MCGLADARVFFALWPDDETAAAIEAAGDRLIGDGRRVARPDLHLTLAFLGRIQPSAIAELKDKAAAVRVAGFNLTLDQVGYFARPRVLWLGPTNTPSTLAQLARAVAATGAGPESSSPLFRPHVSLCRRASAPEAGQRVEPIVWPVRSFCLVESGRDGVSGHYACLGRWSLTGSYS